MAGPRAVHYVFSCLVPIPFAAIFVLFLVRRGIGIRLLGGRWCILPTGGLYAFSTLYGLGNHLYSSIGRNSTTGSEQWLVCILAYLLPALDAHLDLRTSGVEKTIFLLLSFAWTWVWLFC